MSDFKPIISWIYCTTSLTWKKVMEKAAEKYISLIPPNLNVAYQQAFGMAAYIKTTHLYGNHIPHFYVAALANVSFL